MFDAAVYNKAQEERARRLHQALTRQNTYDACTHFSSSFAAAGLSGNLRPPAEVQAQSITYPGTADGLMGNAYAAATGSKDFEIHSENDLSPAAVIDAVAKALDENRAVIIGIDSVALYQAFFQRPNTAEKGIPHAVMLAGVNRSQNGAVRGFYFLDSAVGMSYFADVKAVDAALLSYHQLNGGEQPLFYLKSKHPLSQTLTGRFHSLRLVNLDQDWTEDDKLLCFQAGSGRLRGNLFQRGTPSAQGQPKLLRKDYLSAPLEAQNLRPLDQPWMVAGQPSAYCPELSLSESPLSELDVQGLVLSAGPFFETRFEVFKDASGTRCPAERVQRSSRLRRFDGQVRKQCSAMGNDSFQIDGQAFDTLGTEILPVFGRPAYCSDTSKTLLGWSVHAQTLAPKATDYDADKSEEASHFPLVPMRGYACIQPEAVLQNDFLLALGQHFPDFQHHIGIWKQETPSWTYTPVPNPSPLELPAYVRKTSAGSPQRTDEQEATIAYAALRDLYEQGGSRQDYLDYRARWAVALETHLRTKGVDIWRFRGHELLLLHLRHNRSLRSKAWGKVLVSPGEAELGIYYLARSAEGLLGNPLSRQDLADLGIAADWSRPLFKRPVPPAQKKAP